MSVPAKHWLAAFSMAAAIHGAVFAIASRSATDDMERGQGAPDSEIGAVSMLTLDGQSDLVQEIEPNAGEVYPDAPKQIQELTQAEPEHVAVKDVSETLQEAKQTPQEVTETATIVSETARPEIEPIAEQAVALAVPVEMVAKPLEPLEPPKRVPDKKVPKKKPSRKSQAASVRKGGGTNGRQTNFAGTAALSSYKGRVRARVAGRARSPGGAGMVVVRFIVTASGGVSSAKVVRSASSRLNSAALRAVRGGFPPIPPGLPRSISFTLPIQFR